MRVSHDHISALMRMTLCLTLILTYTSPAEARRKKNFPALTEDQVREFIEETTAITSGNAHGYSTKKILAYLDKHIDKRARFKSIIEYSVPGFPPQETEMSLDKKEFIKNIEEGIEALDDYSSEVEIESINIAPEGQQAIAITISDEKGIMNATDGDNNAKAMNIPLEGTTKCTQTISRDQKNGTIQMFNAICKTSVRFSGMDF